VSVCEVICTHCNASWLQHSFDFTTSEAYAQVEALENQVAELAASHATREEVQEALLQALEIRVAVLSSPHATRKEFLAL
jgi:outer membrane receptor for ferrienterochelin and colicin